jgi:hypothetical protein
LNTWLLVVVEVAAALSAAAEVREGLEQGNSVFLQLQITP